MDAKTKVVAYGLWHESDQRLGNFVHNDIETATYEAGQARKFGYVLMPLVKLTYHEAALAELRTDFESVWNDRRRVECELAVAEQRLTTLLTGLEALADKTFEMTCEEMQAALRTLASAGLEGDGNGN